MPPQNVDDLLRESGAQFRSSQAPDHVDLTWLKIQCGKLERTLRNQHEDRKLEPRHEAELARLVLSDTTGALRRWAYLKHLYLVRSEGLKAPGGKADVDELLVAYQLLAREPVQVNVGTRIVEVKERSLACLVQIGRHGVRIEWLLSRLQQAAELAGQLAEKREPRLRGRMLRVKDEQQALLYELGLQRQALYAHVFTESGAPATSRDEAPDWWEELTLLADALLVRAVNEVGSGRAMKLGTMPEPPRRADQKGRMEHLEDFGWLSTLARWGVKMPVKEADFLTRPLGQALALFRLGADPVYIDD